MNKIKSLFKYLNEPEPQVFIYAWGILFFLLLWLVAGILGWVASTVFVSHVSMVALVLGVWSMCQAARTERRQKETERIQTERMEKEDARLEREKADRDELDTTRSPSVD